VPACRPNGDQLGPLKKATDEVYVNERFQGCATIVSMSWDRTRVFVVPTVQAIPGPATVLPRGSSSTHDVKIP
jgi:hypothetical protein